MLNLNKVGRPLCNVEKGKYNGDIVSVSDQQPNEEEYNEELIKESKIPPESVICSTSQDAVARVSLHIPGNSSSNSRKPRKTFRSIFFSVAR